MQTTDEEAASTLEAYQASLDELDSNCKIKINALTMVADDNKDHAIAIVACIEKQLKTVPKQYKLPVFHLIDSICKNFPKSIYVQLFTQNIVSNFCNVFEVSDEKVRKSLYKLRVTWSKTKMFPLKKLNAIDRRVHEMDPNWPIQTNKVNANSGAANTMANTNSLQRQQQIHQRNLQKREQGQQQQQQHRHHQPQQQQSQSQASQQQPQLLLQQQQQQQPQQIFDLLPNQQQYLPNQAHQVNPQPPPLLISSQASQAQMIFSPFGQPASQPQPAPQILCAPFDQISSQPHAPLGPQIICNPYDTIASQQMVQPQPTSQPLNQQQPPATAATSQPAQQTLLPHLQIETVKSPHSTILESLYGGKQCSNCSLRFDDNNKYSIHLDWHFRQKISKSDTMFARRKWYYPLNLWVQFREINDDDIQDINNSDNNNANDSLLPANEEEIPTALAFKDDEMNICSVCHEEFEKFYVDEEDEWRLKNAKLYEEDGRAYHPLCLKDMLQASEVNTSA